MFIFVMYVNLRRLLNNRSIEHLKEHRYCCLPAVKAKYVIIWLLPVCSSPNERKCKSPWHDKNILAISVCCLKIVSILIVLLMPFCCCFSAHRFKRMLIYCRVDLYLLLCFEHTISFHFQASSMLQNPNMQQM